jgi:hypothetical protein
MTGIAQVLPQEPRRKEAADDVTGHVTRCAVLPGVDKRKRRNATEVEVQ